MPLTLSPAAAATVISGDLNVLVGHDLPPEVRHQHAFVTDVCAALGIDPSSAAMVHVTDLLRKHDIVPHARLEYPKWVTPVGEKNAVMVASADEEQTVLAG